MCQRMWTQRDMHRRATLASMFVSRWIYRLANGAVQRSFISPATTDARVRVRRPVRRQRRVCQRALLARLWPQQLWTQCALHSQTT